MVNAMATNDPTPFQMFDTGGETKAQITTDGATIKPFLNSVAEVVGECRLQLTDGGVEVLAVDAANVFMIRATLPASAFDEYHLPNGDATVGVNVGSFRHVVRRARMDSDDVLDLRITDRKLYGSVDRGYGDDTRVVSEDYTELIDPDSLRQSPDIPDLNMVDVDVSHDVFVDATGHVNSKYTSSVKYELEDGDLVVTGPGDTSESKVRITNAADESETAVGMYSKDYVKSVLKILKKSKADAINFRLADDVPFKLGFERTNDGGDTLLDGMLMLAPRITDHD